MDDVASLQAPSVRPIEAAAVRALLHGFTRNPVRTIEQGVYFYAHECVYPLSDTLTWVDRNEDKPHRCPCCHAVASYDRRTAGPRTRMVCPRGCGVQWRYGSRASRDLSVWTKRQHTGGYLDARFPRFVTETRIGRRRRGGR